MLVFASPDMPRDQFAAAMQEEFEGKLVAGDGAEAIEFVCAQPFDLVLMDVQMPGMDGLETTRHLCCDVRHAGLPILALTANVTPGDETRCLEAGMNGYLRKPIRIRDLVRGVLNPVRTDRMQPR